jgi:uncharacterized repeat protein (TIGR01451 family)
MLKNMKLILCMVLSLSVVSCSDRGCCNASECGTECNGATMACPCDGPVSVTRGCPGECKLGNDVTVKLTATAREDATGVVLKETIPCGLTYVSSCPEATRTGDQLTWELGTMCGGDCKEICVHYRAVTEGCVTACYSVFALPYCCQAMMVGCPKLTLEKCGPEEVRKCCPVQYTISLRNDGSQVARGVTITDEVPEELQHETCLDCLTWEIGDLCPGDCRSFDVCFDAIKCGKAVNTVVARSCDCPPVCAMSTTIVTEPCVELEKTGPEGPIVVGKNADYKIVATNTGSCPLKNVVITDTAPPGTRIKSAPGAEISGNMATWTEKSFSAGEAKTYDITLTSCVHGCLTNQVCATCDEEVGCCAEASTKWIGIAGIWAEIKDKVDPICVGMDEEYCIVLQNQGFAEDNNVQLVLEFPSEMEPVSACGPVNYKISGNTVTFDSIPVLGAGRTLTFGVSAKAKAAGDARVMMKIKSDLLTQPYQKEESTIVY